jgi:MFS transporter, SP family, inositol transporter
MSTVSDGPADALPSEGENWRTTILAGLANYIDAGSIVAGSAALALWQESYKLSNDFIGLIAAFGPNAIGAGVGALVGGWLCDRFGRKKIYQWDMLIYAVGMALLVFAVAPWMIVTGFLIVGLAVGADIPASWSLIAEQAPDKRRGKHSGVAQVLWYLGPVVVLLMSLALTDLGALGARIVFAHLLVIALALTLLRSRMKESRRWEEAQKDKGERPSVSILFKGKYLASILGLVGMYGFWNLWAGTNGFFFPYILRTVGGQSQEASVALQALNFGLGIFSIFFIFMKLSDKVNQKLLFGVSAAMQVGGMALLALFPLTGGIAITHILIMGLATGFGAQSFFQLWSSEMFPTMLRSTAQGICFAIVRISLGIFSFFVPMLTATGFTTLAWILTGFLVISGLIGVAWAPRNEGKSLEQLDAERLAH